MSQRAKRGAAAKATTAKPKARKRVPEGARPALPAEGARERILEVSLRMLREVGPDGLRLQEIAREVGISHPAILHHFGSRAGLVQAVVERSLGELESDVARAVLGGEAEQNPAALIEGTFRALTERGHGRLIAWLALADVDERRVMSQLGDVANLVHELRTQKFAARGAPAPKLEDTSFVVMLASLALVGDAICGNLMRAVMPASKNDPKGERFRRWLAARLVEQLEGER